MRTTVSVFLLVVTMITAWPQHGLRRCVKGMGRQEEPYKTWMREIQNYIACDTHSDGGGWVMVLNRTIPAYGRLRLWAIYKWAFGSHFHNHWLGLENIHNLTNRGQWEVRFDVKDNGSWYHISYPRMWIENETNGYRLHLEGRPSGTMSLTNFTGMACSNGQKFTTYDRDNDDDEGGNCARYHHAAFWYGPRAKCNNKCTAANLLGATNDEEYSQHTRKNMYWVDHSGKFFTRWIEAVEMKIRKK